VGEIQKGVKQLLKDNQATRLSQDKFCGICSCLEFDRMKRNEAFSKSTGRFMKSSRAFEPKLRSFLPKLTRIFKKCGEFFQFQLVPAKKVFPNHIEDNSLEFYG